LQKFRISEAEQREFCKNRLILDKVDLVLLKSLNLDLNLVVEIYIDQLEKRTETAVLLKKILLSYPDDFKL